MRGVCFKYPNKVCPDLKYCYDECRGGKMSEKKWYRVSGENKSLKEDDENRWRDVIICAESWQGAAVKYNASKPGYEIASISVRDTEVIL